MRKVFIVVTAWFALAASAGAQGDNWQLVREKTEARLREIVAETPGVMGVAALDLTSGEQFGINDSLVFPQGSAIKIPILLEVYKQVAEGRLQLTDTRRVAKKDQVGGAGVLMAFGDGTSQLSLRDLCVLMVVLSDNTAANILIDVVGMEHINRTMASLGLKHTRVQRTMMDKAARGRGEENLSTPAEAARLMEILYRCEILDQAACDDILSILKIDKPGTLKRPLPADIPVAFKPGEIPGARAEWAIVYLAERPYVIVVMEKYGWESREWRAAQEISRTLYSYFWRRAHSTRYGTYVDPALIH